MFRNRLPAYGNGLIHKQPTLLGIILVSLLISLPACASSISNSPTNTPGSTVPAGETQRTVKVDGITRIYLLHIPPDLPSNQPVAVVFALHGFDNEHYFEVSDLQNMTGFGEISDQKGFILIYPSGNAGVWNVGGNCCGSSSENNVDEATFMRQILTDVGTIATVDAKKVYATGFSMGGMLAYRLACEMSDTFAAIAPVAAGMLYDTCQPADPVSILQVNGKADYAVPYNGGLGGFMTGEYTFPSVEDTAAKWANLDSCSMTPTTEQQGVALHTAYSSCNAGTSVELYTIDVMGNNWPSKYVFPVSQRIWEFFLAHPKQ